MRSSGHDSIKFAELSIFNRMLYWDVCFVHFTLNLAGTRCLKNAERRSSKLLLNCYDQRPHPLAFRNSCNLRLYFQLADVVNVKMQSARRSNFFLLNCIGFRKRTIHLTSRIRLCCYLRRQQCPKAVERIPGCWAARLNNLTCLLEFYATDLVLFWFINHNETDLRAYTRSRREGRCRLLPPVAAYLRQALQRREECGK